MLRPLRPEQRLGRGFGSHDLQKRSWVKGLQVGVRWSPHLTPGSGVGVLWTPRRTLYVVAVTHPIATVLQAVPGPTDRCAQPGPSSAPPSRAAPAQQRLEAVWGQRLGVWNAQRQLPCQCRDSLVGVGDDHRSSAGHEPNSRGRGRHSSCPQKQLL